MKEDKREWDVHETGHIELSGMTWREYTEWALGEEDNTQPPKIDKNGEKE